MLQKRKVCIAVLFLIFFSVVNIAHAEEQFGISLDCFEPCKDRTIDSSKDIMLVLTIKNNLDFWVSIGQEKNNNYQSIFSINIENSNLPTEKSVEYHEDLSGKRVLIKPKTELQVYVPFDTYNKLGKDNRLGDWKIRPELQINNVEFYKNPFDSKPTPLYYPDGRSFTINSRLTGNILEFKTLKQETKVQVEKSNVVVPEGLLENLYRDYIKEIIAGVAIIVIGYVIISYLPKKTKSKKK